MIQPGGTIILIMILCCVAMNLSYKHLHFLDATLQNDTNKLNNKEGDNRVITIFPGSAQENSVRSFDILNYPLEAGDSLTWFNSDFVDHEIQIINSSGGSIDDKEIGASNDGNNELDLVADSGIIKPKASFDYNFTKPGIYSFLSPLYTWMDKGTVIVVKDGIDSDTNDLKREKITDLENNNLDIEISQYSPNSRIGDTVYWIISFLDNATGQNQEHVDYEFNVYNNITGEIALSEKIHSSYGTEESAHIFNSSGTFISEVTITHILFRPVYPDTANFTSFEIG